MKYKLRIRHIVLCTLLLLVWLTQSVPALGKIYAESIYPVTARLLSSFSRLVPFAVGDLFIALSIAGVLLYPVYARRFQKKRWKQILLNDAEYLLWVYVWFYLAWGLNYARPDFYQRTAIPYTAYTPENFESFVTDYIEKLNASYVEVPSIDKELVRQEAVRGYELISDSLGIHRPFHRSPRVKTMLFTPMASKVGVSGSMGPFFCEFTLNGDVPPSQYPATYAHELAHLLGISSEAEANFYAYQVCTRSSSQSIRFCGYLSVLGHVLANAHRLLDDSAYKELAGGIRPEIIELARSNQAYWAEKYSPVIGAMQDRLYDLYLKGNRIPSGRKNYSEVVGLLISYHSHCNP